MLCRLAKHDIDACLLCSQELFKCSVLMFERLESTFLETGDEDPFLVNMREKLTSCNKVLAPLRSALSFMRSSLCFLLNAVLLTSLR
jgi:hypothetical protein